MTLSLPTKPPTGLGVFRKVSLSQDGQFYFTPAMTIVS